MRVRKCKLCGAEAPLSRHGLCSQCSVKRLAELFEQLRSKRGEIYEKWRTGLMQSVAKRTQEGEP